MMGVEERKMEQINGIKADFFSHETHLFNWNFFRFQEPNKKKEQK